MKVNYCRRQSHLTRYFDDKSTRYRKVVFFRYVKSHVCALLFVTQRVTKKTWMKANIFFSLNRYISMNPVFSCLEEILIENYKIRNIFK